MRLTRRINGVSVEAEFVVTVYCDEHAEPAVVTRIGYWQPPPGHSSAALEATGSRVVDLNVDQPGQSFFADWADTAGCLQTPHGEAAKADRGERAIRDPRPMIAGDAVGPPRSMKGWRWRFECPDCNRTVLAAEPQMTRVLDAWRRRGDARLSIQMLSATM